MTQDISEPTVEEQASEPGAFPFPFNQHTFCRYEPIAQRIEAARVLIVDNLLRDDADLSEIGLAEWGDASAIQLKRERLIAEMALENISTNVARLVKRPTIKIAHLSEITNAAQTFKPDAIVLSGTLRDFDFYNPEIIENFGRFIQATRVPVLGICGGHQIVGMSFGAYVTTLDKLQQHEQRDNRPLEYQYRFIRITDPDDPIFMGLKDPDADALPAYPHQARILRVWQNHGLQLDQVPPGFKLLATSYLCRNQMMVKRSDGQLIYTVQFHLEKSFEDWNKSRTRWEHQNESRDGRILFENFLELALAHSV